MEGVCEVVRIVRKDAPGGFVEINKSDLKDNDVIYGEKKVVVDKPIKNKKGKY